MWNRVAEMRKITVDLSSPVEWALFCHSGPFVLSVGHVFQGAVIDLKHIPGNIYSSRNCTDMPATWLHTYGGTFAPSIPTPEFNPYFIRFNTYSIQKNPTYFKR